MYVAGVDIGYSNLKVIHGLNSRPAPVVATYPAGAAPAVAAELDLRTDQPRASVLVDGEPWLSGVSQRGILHSASRCLTSPRPLAYPPPEVPHNVVWLDNEGQRHLARQHRIEHLLVYPYDVNRQLRESHAYDRKH